MIYFLLLMFGFGSLMLSLIVSICKDAGKLENDIDIEHERDKQREESKEHDKMTDEELLDWLRKNGGI